MNSKEFSKKLTTSKKKKKQHKNASMKRMIILIIRILLFLIIYEYRKKNQLESELQHENDKMYNEIIELKKKNVSSCIPG